MKTLIVFLFALSMFRNVNAQINSSALSIPSMSAKVNAPRIILDIKTELLNLLKSKHDYERRLSVSTGVDPEPYRIKYMESFARIKKHKTGVLSYIDNSLRDDTTVLDKKFVFYNYQSPISSSIGKNMISYLTYFKIIKYTLENQKEILPPLSEISFGDIGMVTNAAAQTNSQDIKTELLNLLKSKHDYERLLSFRHKDTSSYKVKYTESFARIKKNRSRVLLYINNSLKVDSIALSKKILDYKYVSFFSSTIDYKNVISLLRYFKIIKYSLEDQKEILPPLSEISSIIKDK